MRELERRRRAVRVVAGTIGVAAATALACAWLARRAERRHPPRGRFVMVGGVWLHYVDTGGPGDVLVLLHGNGATIEDFAASGLLDRAAQRYRVIAFDRPGFGYSGRPRRRVWTAAAQAELIAAALGRLGIPPAIVLGHSWGASIAIRLAAAQPERVRALVLACGFYYPSLRLDALGASIAGLPIVGDLLSVTAVPLLCRAFWGAIVRRIFGAPAPPASFAAYPREMALRPSQLRAMAAESGLVLEAAAAARRFYGRLSAPTVIVAGGGDHLVDAERHAVRLHRAWPGSRLRLLPGAGHMVHHTATAAVLAAIDEAAALARGPQGSEP